MSEKIKRPTVSSKTWQSLVREIEQLKAERDELKAKEQQAAKVIVYLAGKLSTTEKLSTTWIQEAFKAIEE